MQTIELRTRNFDHVRGLEEEWLAATEDEHTLRRSIVTRDHHDPDRHLDLAFFDDFGSAMVNSNLPAAGEPAGRGPRTVYRTTPAGKRALARWLAEPSAAPAFESEAMVRATFAEYGSKDGLLATIAGLRTHAEQLHAGAEAVATSYLEDRAPFPERAHIVALNGRFILDYIAMVRR